MARIYAFLTQAVQDRAHENKSALPCRPHGPADPGAGTEPSDHGLDRPDSRGVDRLACSGGTLRITRHGTSNSERGAAPLTPPASSIPPTFMIDRAGYPPSQDGPVMWPPPVLSAPVEPGHCGRYGPGVSPRTGLHAS